MLKAAIASVAVAIVAAAAGLALGKVKALLLGVDGVGTLAQVMVFQGTLTTLASVGLSFAVTKYVAEHRAAQSLDRLRSSVWLAALIVFFLSLVTSVSVLVFAHSISIVLLADSSSAVLVALGGLAIPFTAINTFFNRVITGYRDNRLYAGVFILASILSLPVTIGLIWVWGIAGAVLSLTVVPLFQLGPAMYYFRRRHGELFDLQIKQLLSPGAWSIAQSMLALGALALLMGLNTNLCQLVLRTATVHWLGIEANGLYQGVLSISSRLVNMYLGFFSLYVFPKVSETHDPGTVNALTNQILRFTLAMMMPAVAGILLFRNEAIHILLTDKFLPASSLIPAQELGDLFYTIGTVFWIGILSVGSRYTWAVLGMSLYWVQVPVFFLLAPMIGLAALPYSYMTGAIAQSVLSLIALWRYSGFRLSRANVFLLLRSGALLILMVLLTNISWQINLVLLLIGCLWLVSIPTPEEWQSASHRLTRFYALR